MSPVTRLGERCARCQARPVWQGDLCSPCWRLLRAIGQNPTALDGPLSRFDVLVELGQARYANDPGFDLELRAWMDAA